jgi:flagellar M-ring protein FliF
VEQVIAAPGGITRMSVGVIVPGDLDVEKQKHMTDLVRMAAGINDQRGDAIVVQALDQLRSGTSSPAVDEPTSDLAPAIPVPAAASVKTDERFAFNAREALPWLIGAFVVLIVALAGFASMRRVRQVPAALSKRERQALLLEIRKTLEDNAPLPESRIVP